MHFAGRRIDQLPDAQPGTDIGIHGSIALTRSLLRDNLVDELRLAIMLAIAGTGRRLLGESSEARRLALVKARPTSTGALLLTYRVRTT